MLRRHGALSASDFLVLFRAQRRPVWRLVSETAWQIAFVIVTLLSVVGMVLYCWQAVVKGRSLLWSPWLI